jgi:hypothetical protein
VITGFRLPDNSDSCPEYYIIQNNDIPGYNMDDMPISNSSQQDCQNKCTDRGCDWFNYNSQEKTCWLKQGDTNSDNTTVIKTQF